jgi:hypothetical protein
MESLILTLLIWAGSRASDLAQAVWRVVSTMWDLLTSVFYRWGVALQYVSNQAFRLYQAVWGAIFATANTLFWLAVIALPRTLLRAYLTALTLAGQAFDNAIQWAARELVALEVRLRLALSMLRADAAAWVDSLRTDVGTLWIRFLDIERLVTGLLLHPETLADWLAGTIVQAVVRYGIHNGVFLAGLFRRNAVRLTLSLAAVLERIIVDTLM